MAEGAGRAFSGTRKAFIDTGYLLALERRTDQNHSQALEHWRQLKDDGPPSLVSTTYVFDETVTYLNARGLHASAVKVGNRLLGSASIELVTVDEDLLHRAFHLLKRRPDKRYSLTDCASFILMRERSITVARRAFRTGGLYKRAILKVLGLCPAIFRMAQD